MNEDRDNPSPEHQEPATDGPAALGAPDEQGSTVLEPGGTADQPESATEAIDPAAVPSEVQPGDGLVELPIFQSFTQPPPPAQPRRIPNLGDLLLLAVLLLMGFVVSVGLFFLAVHFHLFGASSIQQASNEIHYLLGTEAVIYVVTFGLALLVFPAFWHESLFAGLQWNGGTALRLRGRLAGAAFACFLLASLNEYLIPGPTNTPIEKVFKTPGAAWLLFGFGVTFAPFFEEMFFRGFLLPSLCTAYDWVAEKITGSPPRLPAGHGNSEWSLGGLIVGSIATSIPFAAMHAEQTGYSIGPFLLLMGVSLVLCGVRLFTRSLASSTLVHACYNFLIFSIMLVGTGGFRHLDKM
jgi:membrane protease YdiL (CAAX protease family)